ncbi:hypothetical protein GCM10008967_06100 [Bacillus carboniphilus]|uniref:EfeO-type cupredoxin-like domain-containing protein n=1 Tax=Bacillus carboniphilus TaxID=86663 RepID=A0ABN0VVJ3_9BACI
MQFIVVKKKNIVTWLALFVVVLIGGFLYFMSTESEPAFGFLQDSKSEDVRDIHMITAEFTMTMENGKTMDAYRWDPGSIFIEKGEKVNLKIYGINGSEHPFYIEGTDIRGTVKKGEETVVPLQFDKEGVYKIVCTIHQGEHHQAPMIGYIYVD